MTQGYFIPASEADMTAWAERLAKALKEHKLHLKHTKARGVLAEAFGHQTNNAITARIRERQTALDAAFAAARDPDVPLDDVVRVLALSDDTLLARVDALLAERANPTTEEPHTWTVTIWNGRQKWHQITTPSFARAKDAYLHHPVSPSARVELHALGGTASNAEGTLLFLRQGRRPTLRRDIPDDHPGYTVDLDEPSLSVYPSTSCADVGMPFVIAGGAYLEELAGRIEDDPADDDLEAQREEAENAPETAYASPADYTDFGRALIEALRQDCDSLGYIEAVTSARRILTMVHRVACGEASALEYMLKVPADPEFPRLFKTLDVYRRVMQ